jgi:hypothetical protein
VVILERYPRKGVNHGPTNTAARYSVRVRVQAPRNRSFLVTVFRTRDREAAVTMMWHKVHVTPNNRVMVFLDDAEGRWVRCLGGDCENI